MTLLSTEEAGAYVMKRPPMELLHAGDKAIHGKQNQEPSGTMMPETFGRQGLPGMKL